MKHEMQDARPQTDLLAAGRRKFKISDHARRDFEFLRDTDLHGIGVSIGCETPLTPDGYTALECWYAKDTHGETLPCREPAELDKAIRGKASWNLQIKQWAEDIADGMLLQQSELVDYCAGLPEWVFDATMNQASKLCREKLGWIPRFARLERLYGQWWPPYMRDFDASV